MFFKRPGVLKTKNMMKIFEKLDFRIEGLDKFLEENKKNAEDFRKVELLCKQALGKLFSGKPELVICGEGAQRYSTVWVSDMLKSLGLDPNDDLFSEIVKYALGFRVATVTSAPKDRKSDIYKLYSAAKNEKQRLKAVQNKICDDLKQWEKLLKNTQSAIDKIMSKEMVKGLWFDSYKKEIHRSSTNFKKFTKYKREYDNSVAKMCNIKHDIRNLLGSCDYPESEIYEIYDAMKYPLIDMGKLRKMKEEQIKEEQSQSK